jgi:hypothetical protein
MTDLHELFDDALRLVDAVADVGIVADADALLTEAHADEVAARQAIEVAKTGMEALLGELRLQRAIQQQGRIGALQSRAAWELQIILDTPEASC